MNRKIAKSEEEIAKQTLKARQILDSARASSEFIFRQLEELKKQEDKEKRAEMMANARNEVRRRIAESDLAKMDVTSLGYACAAFAVQQP